MGIFAHVQKLAIPIPIATCTLPILIPIFGISVFPFPWESHGNGNPIQMHISSLSVLPSDNKVINKRHYYYFMP